MCLKHQNFDTKYADPLTDGVKKERWAFWVKGCEFIWDSPEVIFDSLIYDSDLNRKKCLLALFLKDKANILRRDRKLLFLNLIAVQKFIKLLGAAEWKKRERKVNQYILRESINLF